GVVPGGWPRSHARELRRGVRRERNPRELPRFPRSHAPCPAPAAGPRRPRRTFAGALLRGADAEVRADDPRGRRPGRLDGAVVAPWRAAGGRANLLRPHAPRAGERARERSLRLARWRRDPGGPDAPLGFG